MPKHLIIGGGEIGSSLQKVLDCPIHDPMKNLTYNGMCDFLHICIPYSDGFIKIVDDYRKLFKPLIVVIHSTVPVGTTRILNAVHSPVRGVHPNLEQGIRTFVKYFGGEKAEEAAEEFKKRGIEVKCYEKPENTEALKLWSTTYYYWNIHFVRAVKKYCEKNDLDFDVVYKSGNQTYNSGYKDLQMGHVIRPVLDYKEGKTGGHCLVPNAKLLGEEISQFLLNEEDKL